jgi:GMP synthase-like glutamine amidotransferase
MITILQHGEHEPAGAIGDYLQELGLPCTNIRPYEGDDIPDKVPDRLIVLGGQMSVNDTDEYPFFFQEKSLIKKAIGKKCIVLGICLGAQMIASAQGKPVYPGTPERGWVRIHGCDTGTIFPGMSSVFHWHNETFDLPDGATLTATGDAVENQSFIIGSSVGVQFHPEVTVEIITDWARDLPGTEQTQLLKDSARYLPDNTRFCRRLIDAFLRGWKP